MRKFLGRMAGILTCILFLFLCLNFLFYRFGKQSRLVAFEVYDAIDLVGRQTDYTGVLLGDSVARQFFSPDDQQKNQDICYLATNQAIMPVGNYLLLGKYLKNNPQTQVVYYMARPDSLCSAMNFHYTYSYFVTPLYIAENKKYLDNATIKEIEDKYGKIFAENNYIKWLLAKYPKLLDMYNNACSSLDSINEKWSKVENADISILYLHKIKELCDEKGIEFHILSVPVSEDYEFDFSGLKTAMKQYEMDELYEELLNSVEYISADEFVDGIHLNSDYVEENKERIQRKISMDICGWEW